MTAMKKYAGSDGRRLEIYTHMAPDSQGNYPCIVTDKFGKSSWTKANPNSLDSGWKQEREVVEL